jgi:hypothetical protein
MAVPETDGDGCLPTIFFFLIAGLLLGGVLQLISWLIHLLG